MDPYFNPSVFLEGLSQFYHDLFYYLFWKFIGTRHKTFDLRDFVFQRHESGEINKLSCVGFLLEYGLLFIIIEGEVQGIIVK